MLSNTLTKFEENAKNQNGCVSLALILCTIWMFFDSPWLIYAVSFLLVRIVYLFDESKEMLSQMRVLCDRLTEANRSDSE